MSATTMQLQVLVVSHDYEGVVVVCSDYLAEGEHDDDDVFLDALGDALFHLHRYKEAADARGRQLAFRLAHGCTRLEEADTRFEHGRALHKCGHSTEALREATHAYLDRLDTLGVEDDETQAALLLCVYILNGLGRYEEMVDFTGELARVSELVHGPDDSRTEDAQEWHDHALSMRNRLRPSHLTHPRLPRSLAGGRRAHDEGTVDWSARVRKIARTISEGGTGRQGRGIRHHGHRHH
jgi:hypothetical protein